ncbi:hypothetical protein H6P81_018491 [Aristolochia fimbriata]|uniref:GH10 domain-containing protein n=1 Tax=Aristolochia fimbriata TaxID=158543 RepID=A0AAV7E4B2_ARIFI|nr:hypothetical protein H6P81_018491 [Aristolochia fimbriata]
MEMKAPGRRLVAFLGVLVVTVCFVFNCSGADSNGGSSYDPTAYTECKEYPEEPLYNGGILGDFGSELGQGSSYAASAWVESPAFVLENLTQNAKYSFSCWVKIRGANSSLVTARLSSNNTNQCIGNVLARNDCWSFLKGGFVPSDSSSSPSLILFQNSLNGTMTISVRSASLQAFTDEQWRTHQDEGIRTKRKRWVTIHVSDAEGQRLPGASVSVKQISKDFPFGSAIAKTIIGNLPYQKWFTERFNAAVFENELKWYATESKPGQLNYTLADEMLSFVRANQILARGHNIFWEDPRYTPPWVVNLTGPALSAAVESRIRSLMSRYGGDFVHWDVSNEMLHWDFYEQRLGPNATLGFFRTAQAADPRATLFMNDFNVVETCEDANSTVDAYVSRLIELQQGGARLEGVGLEGHFTKPNLPLMRAVLDKLATLNIPIWLTEIDISKTIDHKTQAVYLEEVLREGFSHPAVDGIMLWTALHPNGCYQMCLTDNDLKNLPAGDAVDRLLREWDTGDEEGETDEHGNFGFEGFLGEYEVSVRRGSRSVNTTFSVPRSDETRHFNVQL